jgi:cobalt/nickel transport system permease protein
MNLSALDRYQKIDSPLHRLDPRVKLIGTVAIILSNALLPDGAWLGFALSLLLVVALNLFSRLGWAYSLKRSLIALPFALAAVSAAFTMPGNPLFSFHIGAWLLTISDAGLLRFSSILIRSWLSVQVAILLAATTPFHALAHGMRHLHMPRILIAIVSFMYRYLFLLNEEAIRLMRGRAARSAAIPGGKGQPVAWQAGVAGNMVGQLFVRSLERSDRVYNAMQARGFRGQFLTLSPHEVRSRDWIALIIVFIILTCIQLSSIFLH